MIRHLKIARDTATLLAGRDAFDLYDPEPRPARDFSPEACAAQIDAVLLKQIVLSMPPNLQEVFVLSRFAHLEYQEIGERLNLPVTTVQWRMRKALEHCAAQLRL